MSRKQVYLRGGKLRRRSSFSSGGKTPFVAATHNLDDAGHTSDPVLTRLRIRHVPKILNISNHCLSRTSKISEADTVARELTNNNETAIREIFDKWAAAVRAEDINGIRANHSPDMLMFDVPPPLFSRGLDAYMDTWNLFYKCQVRPVVFNFDDVKISAGEDVAFVTAIGRCVYIPSGGGPTKLQFRLTMGLHKQDGKWQIVHEHHSVPAEESETDNQDRKKFSHDE